MAKKVQFKWEGTDDLRQSLENVGLALDDKDKAVKDAIYDGAAVKFVAEARARAPEKTGRLRNAIYASKGSKATRGVLLGVRRGKGRDDPKGAFYAHFVEFGTSKHSPQPYFRPALLKMAGTYADDIAPGIRKIVETTAAHGR